MRRLVYTHNYNYWLDKYPAIRANIPFRRMFLKLAFGRNEEGKIILSHRTVAEIEGAEVDNHYVARQFLNAYQAAFPRFAYSSFSHAARRCRIALNDGFDDDDRARIAEEIAREHDAPKTNFLTGRQLDANMRMELRAEDQRNIPPAQYDDALFIQEYLNRLSPRGFALLLRNVGAARAVAAQLNANLPKYTKCLRSYQLGLLNEIEEQPQPYVRPSRKGCTVRLMPANRGISLLEKSVRRALTPNWTELDLAYAQFAICAKLWGVTWVQEFLRDRARNLWRELAIHLGLDASVIKKALKNKGVYPLLYGMPEANVAAGVTKELAKLGFVLHGQAGMSYGRLFLTCPMIVEMLTARKQMQEHIKAEGGAHNCYGEWIAYEGERGNDKSVLAQLAQAVEMQLITPVFRVAQESDRELTVMLYQFDGVSVTTRRRAQRAYWIRQAIAAVDEQAQMLGIQTRLEEAL